jgi:hypothetical protein
MKIIFTTLVALFITLYAGAQSFETKSEYNKQQQPAVMSEFAYPPDLVEDVILEDLKQKGFGKGKSTKGYTLYQAINFTEISGEKIDLYVKIEKKSRKEKDISIVTFLVSKGYENFVSGTSDANMMQNIMNYVN